MIWLRRSEAARNSSAEHSPKAGIFERRGFLHKVNGVGGKAWVVHRLVSC